MMSKRTILIALGAVCLLFGLAVAVVFDGGEGDGEQAAAEKPADQADQAAAGQPGGPGGATPAARVGHFTIPDGMRAVAVQVGFVAGGGGYAAPGDHVDVYVTLAPEHSPNGVSETHLVLSGVEVLDVSQQVQPLGDAGANGQVRSSGDKLTYLLAVTPEQGEALVFTTGNADVYLALAPQGAPAVDTPGFRSEDVVTRGPLVSPVGG